jgi:hypothetical protein
MPNGHIPLDLPAPVTHLKNVAEVFRRYDEFWSHLKYQEMGGDIIHLSGLPQNLIRATEDLYSEGRDLAQMLADVFGNVTNPDRFVYISDFVRYVDEHIFPRFPALDTVLTKCQTELSALPDQFDTEAEEAFMTRQTRRDHLSIDIGVGDSEAQTHSGVRSLSHLRSTIRVMIRQFRHQLDLLHSVENDLATLRGHRNPTDERPPAIISQPAVDYAFYRDGPSWVITFKGRSTPIEDLRGLYDYAYLLARPTQTVSALDLMLATAKHDPDASRRMSDPREREQAGMDDKFARVLDDAAIRDLKAQVDDLKRDLARAEENHDESQTERLQDELEQIQSFLATNIKQRFPDDRKKAQTAVYRRMILARKRIAERLPELAEYLARHVDTVDLPRFRRHGG